jgi:hypothetical protein
MIQLFGTDLDGTLLVDHVCTDYIRGKLNTLLENGAYICLATGRNKRNAFAEHIPCSHAICLNGSVIYDEHQNPIIHHPISKKIVAEILEDLADLPLEFNCLQGTYVLCSKEDFIAARIAGQGPQFPADPEKTKNFFAEHHCDCSKEEILAQDVLKIEMISADEKEREKLESFLLQHKDKLVNAGSYPWVYEITSFNVSKANALLELAKLLHLTPDETAVYGDGGNDMEMLSKFEHSYCPADGQEQAKKTANSIIAPHDTYSVIDHIFSTYFSDKREHL